MLFILVWSCHLLLLLLLFSIPSILKYFSYTSLLQHRETGIQCLQRWYPVRSQASPAFATNTQCKKRLDLMSTQATESSLLPSLSGFYPNSLFFLQPSCIILLLGLDKKDFGNYLAKPRQAMRKMMLKGPHPKLDASLLLSSSSIKKNFKRQIYNTVTLVRVGSFRENHNHWVEQWLRFGRKQL